MAKAVKETKKEASKETKKIEKMETKRKAAPVGTGARFGILKKEIETKGGAKDAGAIAAAIGRKKYGKAGMAKMAAAGKKKG